MKRMAIFGSPGAGKSTLAKQLSAHTGIPAFFLDRYYFDPGWVIKPASVFKAAIASVIVNDCWITDGNYLSESIEVGRIERADTLILLECPRLRCLARVLRRMLINYGRVRSDQAPGCPERFSWSFIQFVWNYPQRASQIRQLLHAQSANKSVIILSSPQQVKQFLHAL